jgi:2-methylaconitate cis-trans-isomerase PrpF
VVRRSARPDADVDFTFVQVDVEHDALSYDGGCGNISAAVGPYAIDEGLVPAEAPVTTVRIYSTNTDQVLVAKVPVRGSKALTQGACAIAGVPGTGSEIVMDYAGTVGSRTGLLLPTGNAVDWVKLEDGRSFEVSVCDVANPCVFVSAADFGLTGSELPPVISGNRELVATLAEIRGKVGQRLGFWADWSARNLPAMPMLVMVAPPGDYRDLDGLAHAGAAMDLRARLLYLDVCHPSLAGTGAICLAAASRIAGTLVNRALSEVGAASASLRIGHPRGVIDVRVSLDEKCDSASPRFAILGFARTARRLMAGSVYLPDPELA